MKKQEIIESLFYDYTRLETGEDLMSAGLTLSEYNELYRVIRVLSLHETAHTYSESVKRWLESHALRVLETDGVYFVILPESEV